MRKVTAWQVAGVLLAAILAVVLFYAVVIAGIVWIVKVVWT